MIHPANEMHRRSEGTRIYMDHNGSVPLLPEAAEAMASLLHEAQGNPGSGHWAAAPARQIIETARASVADLIGADPADVILTGGATEANNTAIRTAARPGAHVLTSAIEHDSVLAPVRALRREGVGASFAPVDRDGRVDPERLAAMIRPETALISVMHANNETGVIQPVAAIARHARAAGVPLHVDAAQSVGKIAVHVDALGCDMLSVAGHKFGAPKGIGALWVRPGTPFRPLLRGGAQEGGRRAGTESALLAAGLDAAARKAAHADMGAVEALRDRLLFRLVSAFGERVVVHGAGAERVPNTLSVALLGHVGADILASLPEVAATTGSACHASCVDVSRVLLAMKVPTPVALGTIRFSLGLSNTAAEVDWVARHLTLLLNDSGPGRCAPPLPSLEAART